MLIEVDPKTSASNLKPVIIVVDGMSCIMISNQHSTATHSFKDPVQGQGGTAGAP